jgi:hypothetical protein
MQIHNAKTDSFPQFERSPESFPKLTVFPEDWDLSAILKHGVVMPPVQPGESKSWMHLKFTEPGTNAGTSNAL